MANGSYNPFEKPMSSDGIGCQKAHTYVYLKMMRVDRLEDAIGQSALLPGIHGGRTAATSH